MSENTPPFLDEDGQELWKMADWILSGNLSSPSAQLQMQALAIRRELRAESKAVSARRELVDKLVDYLFEAGNREVAARLVLIAADGRDMGYWSREGAKTSLFLHLRELA